MKQVRKPKKKSNSKRRMKTNKNSKILKTRIVNLNKLKWNKIDVPDHIDDLGGFYELEEIDDVEVRLEKGKTTFYKNLEHSKIEKQDEIEIVSEDEVYESNKNDVFTGFEDDNFDDNFIEKKQNCLDSNLEILNNDSEKKKIEMDMHDWCNFKFQIEVSILKSLFNLGFKSPTKIQSEVFNHVIDFKDLIAKSSTGSGKTFAYGIPILQSCFNSKKNMIKPRTHKITALIFLPTRELVHQVVDSLKSLLTNITTTLILVMGITGGLSIQKQQRIFNYNPDIIVATPGRFSELIEVCEDFVSQLSFVKTIVFDEADKLFQYNHFTDLKKSLENIAKFRLKNNIKTIWQTLIFSATFSTDLFQNLNQTSSKKLNFKSISTAFDDKILELFKKKLTFKDSNPIMIDSNPNEIVSKKIFEAMIECESVDKDLYLYYFLLLYQGSTIIFTNSIKCTKRLTLFLSFLKLPVFCLNSSSIQKQRLRNLENFRSLTELNKKCIIICTDVAARGIDIPKVDHVIHYHIPTTADIYIHRSGRSARGEDNGLSIVICTPKDVNGGLKKLMNLVKNEPHSSNNKLLNFPIDLSILKQLKNRVDIASNLANSSISSNYINKSNSWIKKAVDDLEIDEDMDFEDKVIEKDRKKLEKKQLTKLEFNTLKRELTKLLNIKLRKNSRISYITSDIENIADKMLKLENCDFFDCLGESALDVIKKLYSQKSK